MAIIRKPCEVCGKQTDITSELDLGAFKLLIFACGHSRQEEKLTQETPEVSQEVADGKSLFARLKDEVPSYCEEHDRVCIKTIQSHSGKHLFPYQRDGIVASTENNARFIFADEMGLGKTAQGLGTILVNIDKLLPAIFVCKSIAKTNMLWESMDWLQVNGVPLPAQIINKSSETPYDIFKMHIISYDMLNRLDKLFKFSEFKNQWECPECKYLTDKPHLAEKDCPQCSRQNRTSQINDKVETYVKDGKQITEQTSRLISEKLLKVPKLLPYIDKSLFTPNMNNSLKDVNKAAWYKILKSCKTIILDEVHLIKNPESQRSKALKVICANIPHVLPMSGTVTKNNSTEYFVPLNIVAPDRFWRYNSFCENHCRQEYVRSVTGTPVIKFTGLISPDHFFNHTVKNYMIRRTVDDVLPDLPKLFKQPKYVELDERFQSLYEDSEKDFVEWFDNASAQEIKMDILGKLAILRHQTSLSKIDFTIDLALSFMLETTKKLAIFTHHIDSREFLADKMIQFFRETNNGDNVVRVLTQGSSVQEEIEQFRTSETERIIILSTLSHGESINLQFMSDCILHERQWNPANEDQAISGRFRRIGQEAKSIGCMIPVAIGTIDEYFVELIERKRAHGREIDSKQVEDWSSSGFIADLAQKIAEKGREKWRL